MEERRADKGGTSPPMPPATPVPPEQRAPGDKRMSTKKRAVLVMAIALVILLLVAGSVGGLYAWRFLRAANALTIDDVDFSLVPDGTYSGYYSVFHVEAAVEVDVRGGRVASIDLIDSGRITGERKEQIRDMLNEVVRKQSLEVDVTSGASVSKKVSLKAVEDALTGDR